MEGRITSKTEKYPHYRSNLYVIDSTIDQNRIVISYFGSATNFHVGRHNPTTYYTVIHELTDYYGFISLHRY